MKNITFQERKRTNLKLCKDSTFNRVMPPSCQDCFSIRLGHLLKLQRHTESVILKCAWKLDGQDYEKNWISETLNMRLWLHFLMIDKSGKYFSVLISSMPGFGFQSLLKHQT